MVFTPPPQKKIYTLDVFDILPKKGKEPRLCMFKVRGGASYILKCPIPNIPSLQQGSILLSHFCFVSFVVLQSGDFAECCVLRPTNIDVISCKKGIHSLSY